MAVAQGKCVLVLRDAAPTHFNDSDSYTDDQRQRQEGCDARKSKTSSALEVTI